MTLKKQMRHRKAVASLFLALFLFFVLSSSVAYMAYFAEASGVTVYSKSGTELDASNTSKGYFMIKRSSSKRQKLQVTKSGSKYVYDINADGTFEIIPLQLGNGTYKIELYEQVSGSSYTAKYSKEIKVTLDSEYINYLYPNQRVNFDQNTEAIALANELCAGLTTEKEKYAAVRDYIKKNVVYDYMKALQVTGKQIVTYLPDIDATLDSKMGICYDYAALAACMLRSQGVHTKLVVGLADSSKHAWNEILIDGKWARFDLTYAVTGTKVSENGYVKQEEY